MPPTVFISHSCKDHEDQPPEGLTDEQIAERAKRLDFARRLRGEVDKALRAEDIRVFLDVRGGLKPGDLWRNGLHENLRNCAGAVILLTPESLQSGWVLKEATILSWRVFLGEPLKLVPVVCGLDDDEINQRGFGSLDLDAIQWLKVNYASDDSITDAVQQITVAFSSLPQQGTRKSGWETTAGRWLSEFAKVLKKGTEDDPDQYVDKMWRALQVEPPSTEVAKDPFVGIATEALASTHDKILDLVQDWGKRFQTAPEKEVVASQVRPLWVDATAASQLPLAAKAGRLVAIDAKETEIACDYVRRAYCNFIDADRILSPSDVTSDETAQILAGIDAFLDRYIEIEDIEELKKNVKYKGPIYLILGSGLIRKEVIDSLTQKYSPLTLVAVTGPNVRQRLGDHWSSKALLLKPTLQPNKEKRALRYRNKLDAFVTGKTNGTQ